MSGATIKKIEALKGPLSKKVGSVESLSDEDVESLKDMLQQLDALDDVNLEVLTKTLIGTVVSKFKKHAEIGPTAKALVKKWKAAAKGEAAAGAKPTAAAAKKPKEEAAKPKRRNSTNAATDEMKEAWFTLQPYRQTTCQKLNDVLEKAKPTLIKQGINADALDHLTVERATDIEMAIQTKFMSQKQEYLGKARSLCFNLKKNTGLAAQIILGQVPSKELVGMTSEQLISDEKRKEFEERKKSLMDANMLDWEAQNEDKINEMCGIKGELLQASLFTCGRCKSTKTTSTQKQTRSADEPMTVFVLCLNCNNRWKFS
uniref:Transcription elongation factor n=1 Tax=Pseudo-nitzschia delicatissima TaxID=44447 RepID=A0A7S0XKL3_9STRA|mmetsp:Transcript_1220/g.2763  ORF Transcript_1220/g.2763 Transcript_1220/m.2763 type:complete len:316 (+) Transcript_1220:144-1091(+)